MGRREVPSLFEGDKWYLIRQRPVSIADFFQSFSNPETKGPASKWSGSLLA